MGSYHFHILISLPSNSSLSTRFLHINSCFSYCFILPSTTLSFIFHCTPSSQLRSSTFHPHRHYLLHFLLLHLRSFHFLFPPPSLPLSLFSLSSYFIHLSAITFVPHTFSSLTLVPSTFPRILLLYLFISSTFLSPCPYFTYLPSSTFSFTYFFSHLSFLSTDLSLCIYFTYPQFFRSSTSILSGSTTSTPIYSTFSSKNGGSQHRVLEFGGGGVG